MANQYSQKIPCTEHLKYFLYALAGLFLDSILFVLALFVTSARLPDKKLPIDDQTLDKFLKGRLKETLRWSDVHTNGIQRFDTFYDCLFAKPCDVWPGGRKILLLPEADTIAFVRQHTTIPVPKVYGHLHSALGPEFMVTEYIKGPTLAEAWPKLSLFRKFWVLLTLHRYINEMHCMLKPFQGEVGPITKPKGTKRVLPELEHFINCRIGLESYEELKKWFTEIGGPYGDSRPLVFCHADLHMRNIILGEDGQVWLIDWGEAGFWPQWFEYKLMHRYHDTTWKVIAGIVCGYDPWTMLWWRKLRADKENRHIFLSCFEE